VEKEMHNMKNRIFIAGIISIMLVFLLCGCTEDNTGTNGTGAKTVTMTAEELQNDATVDTDWETYITIDYESIEDGDTLIIQDTIDSIEYDELADSTLIEMGSQDSPFMPIFEGDLTGSYQVGDEVKITVTIKHVTFSYEDEVSGLSMDYDMELFDEQWTSQEDFFETGGGALPQSSISKV
jgi:hypothetical protein